jgi:hypothetical protein
MQTNYSPETGLLPDFIVDVDETARPADPNYLEGDLDGNYSYNACRDPWRMASDYLISGDERAREAVLKIDHWLLESTGGSTNKVYAGYYLDGTKAASWTDNSFTAPFMVGAMLDTANQEWLNKLYSKVLQSNTANGGYYDNTLRLLSLITLSGNYWVPDCDILNGVKDLKKHSENSFKVYPTGIQGEFTVKVNPFLNNRTVTVSVMDLQGRVVKRSALSANSKIDLQSFPQGLYFVTLAADNNILGSQKIVR